VNKTSRGGQRYAGAGSGSNYIGSSSAASRGTPGGTDFSGPKTKRDSQLSVAKRNQPIGSYRGNKSASVGAVNMRGEKRDPARQGYGIGSKKNESTKRSSAFGGSVRIANSGMTAADFQRGYKPLGSMRDSMNSSQGGARGK
jgi:hypothetical protein